MCGEFKITPEWRIIFVSDAALAPGLMATIVAGSNGLRPILEGSVRGPQRISTKMVEEWGKSDRICRKTIARSPKTSWARSGDATPAPTGGEVVPLIAKMRPRQANWSRREAGLRGRARDVQAESNPCCEEMRLRQGPGL